MLAKNGKEPAIAELADDGKVNCRVYVADCSVTSVEVLRLFEQVVQAVRLIEEI